MPVRSRSLLTAAAACLVLALVASASTQEAPWSRYMRPTPPRFDEGAPASRSQLAGGFRVKAGLYDIDEDRQYLAAWTTPKCVIASVSQRVDEERMSAAEAEEAYASITAVFDQRANYVIFLLNAKQYGRLDEVNDRSLFLQRADDRAVFSRGTLTDGSKNPAIDAVKHTASAFVLFPKFDEKRRPLVRSADDELEMVLALESGKRLVFKFEVAKMLKSGYAASIADL